MESRRNNCPIIFSLAEVTAESMIPRLRNEHYSIGAIVIDRIADGVILCQEFDNAEGLGAIQIRPSCG